MAAAATTGPAAPGGRVAGRVAAAGAGTSGCRVAGRPAGAAGSRMAGAAAGLDADPAAAKGRAGGGSGRRPRG